MKSIILFCALLIGSASYSQSVGDLVVTTKALNEVANNALEKADNILSDQQRQLYLNLLNGTDYILGQLKDQMNDLDRRLTDKQIALLNSLTELQTSLANQSEVLQNKMEDLALVARDAVASTWFGSKRPVPVFYNIPVVSTVQNKVIEIEVKGVKMQSRKNYIVFKGRKIPVSSVRSNHQISFSIPLTEQDVFRHDTLNTFTLVLHRTGFLTKYMKYEYNPKFVVMPSELSSVKVVYKASFAKREDSNGHSGSVSATSGSRSTKHVHKQFNLVNDAKEGWRIDRNSISCRKSSGRGAKHGYGFDQNNTTDISFVAKAFAKDGKAVCTCTWNEYRYVPQDSVMVIESALQFGETKVVELPSNYVNLIRTEVLFKGSTTPVVSMLSEFRQNNFHFKLDQLTKKYQISYGN